MRCFRPFASSFAPLFALPPFLSPTHNRPLYRPSRGSGFCARSSYVPCPRFRWRRPACGSDIAAPSDRPHGPRRRSPQHRCRLSPLMQQLRQVVAAATCRRLRWLQTRRYLLIEACLWLRRLSSIALPRACTCITRQLQRLQMGTLHGGLQQLLLLRYRRPRPLLHPGLAGFGAFFAALAGQ